MADAHLSLWLDQPHPSEAAAAGAGLALGGSQMPSKAVEIELLDSDRNPVGDAFAVDVPAPVRMEVPSGDAGFDWTEATPPLSFAVDELPEAATSLVASRSGLALAELSLENLRAAGPRPPDHIEPINSGAEWKLILVSEMFGDRDAFVAACRRLHTFIVGQPPFSDPAVSAKFGVVGLFWESDASLFNVKVDGRLVFGDNRLVLGFANAAGVAGRMIVVLVNMNVRGGAGGTTERPAWVTTTSSANEDWEAVALHELGHSFGLADEYDDASQPTPEPTPLEPNVTDRQQGSQAPWAALCTPGLAHNPTQNASGQPAGVAITTIGTFEGARYNRQGRYRSSPTCLMRSTARNMRFCAVCQSVIRRVLA